MSSNNFITPESLGAKGDGSIDDTVYVQAAIDQSAGRVLLRPGATYIISAELTSPYPNTTILCEGTASFILQGNYGKILTIGGPAVPAGRVRVAGLAMRLEDAGHWLGPAIAVQGVTNANPGVVTAANHGFSNGTKVFVQNVGGATQINGQHFIVQGVVTNSFYLTDLQGNNVDTTHWGKYTSGGSVSMITQQFDCDTTSGIDNQITNPGWGIRIYNPVYSAIERCSFQRSAQHHVWLDAPSYCEITDCDFTGFWDGARPGVQECIANIYVPASSGLATYLKIRDCTLEGTGISCGSAYTNGNAKAALAPVTVGNATVNQRVDIGAKYGLLVETCEGLDISGCIFGGHNACGIFMNVQPYAPNAYLLGHVDIHDNFFDGDNQYSIEVATGVGPIVFLGVHNNHCNGGDVCNRLLNIEGPSGSSSVGSLRVTGNAGQGYRCSPIALRGVQQFTVADNQLFAYNQLGDTSGESDVFSAIWIDPSCSGGSVHSNQGCGGVNSYTASNHCKFTVYSYGTSSVHIYNNIALNPGLSGGGASNVAQASPT